MEAAVLILPLTPPLDREAEVDAMPRVSLSLSDGIGGLSFGNLEGETEGKRKPSQFSLLQRTVFGIYLYIFFIIILFILCSVCQH